MISDITRKALNARLAALALLALCLVQPQARAQEEAFFVFNTISWGMVRGQTVRFSVFNPNEPSERGWEPRRVVFIQVMLFDSSGAFIANSDEIAIPPSQFRSVDFHREDLSVATSDVGGRVQMSAQVRYRSFSIVDRTNMTGVPTSIELIDVGTGHTTLVVSHKPNEFGFLGSRLPVIAPSEALTELAVIVYASRGLPGLTHGQTLRVNTLIPGDPADRQRRSVRAVRARVKLYGDNGALLAQSTEVIIAPGEFHSFDFDRADISASGEPVSGRLQMRVSLEIAAIDPSWLSQYPNPTGPGATSLELIDNSTGRTTAVWLTTGFFEVVPPRNP